VLDEGQDPLMGRGNFEGEGRPVVKCRDTLCGERCKKQQNRSSCVWVVGSDGPKESSSYTGAEGRCHGNQFMDAIFSERELTFTFAICCRPSVCLSVCRLSSVTFVRPTQAVEIFRNISTALGTLAIR